LTSGILRIGELAIMTAADEQALRLVARLFKQAPIEGLVGLVLSNASERGNSFNLVYQAIETHDPALEKAVIAWAQTVLTDAALNMPMDMRRQFAAALVDRYGSVPTRAQWEKDPIASKLKLSSVESFQSEMIRLAGETARKPAPK
jgi:hypothetical protein